MSTETPGGWCNRRLGDIVGIVSDGISADAIAKLAAVAHYSLPAFDNGRAPEITAGLNIRSNKTLVPTNCVLFSKLNPRIPRVWRIAERSYLPSVCSTEFWPLIPRNDKVDLDFVAAFVSSTVFLNDPQITPSSSTNSHQRVDRRSFENYILPLPPLNEQRRIAEVLRSVDEAVTANRTSLTQMIRVRDATLYDAFEESAWDPVRLGNLGRWSSGGTPSKSDETLWDGDVPWICPRDMKSPVVTRAESTVSEKAVGGACKLVPKGTLLLVVRGMILAKTIPTATTAMSATYNQDIKAFHPNGRAIPKFVQLCLQHQTRNLLRHVNTATHGTKKLDAQTIANVVIPLPDLSMQIELSDAITDMDLAMVRLGEEHVRLMRTKAAIQAELLHGKVRVPR